MVKSFSFIWSIFFYFYLKYFSLNKKSSFETSFTLIHQRNYSVFWLPVKKSTIKPSFLFPSHSLSDFFVYGFLSFTLMCPCLLFILLEFYYIFKWIDWYLFQFGKHIIHDPLKYSLYLIFFLFFWDSN